MGKNYSLRTERNEASRQTAGRFKDAWSDDDVTFLRENFGVMSKEELAAALGRTVEACRQRFYTKADASDTMSVSATRQTPGQRAWARGVTSFSPDYW